MELKSIRPRSVQGERSTADAKAQKAWICDRAATLCRAIHEPEDQQEHEEDQEDEHKRSADPGAHSSQAACAEDVSDDGKNEEDHRKPQKIAESSGLGEHRGEKG